MFENLHKKMLKREKKRQERKKSGLQRAAAKHKSSIWKMKRLAKLANQVIRGRGSAHGPVMGEAVPKFVNICVSDLLAPWNNLVR